MRVAVIPYKMGSQSARLLSNGLQTSLQKRTRLLANSIEKNEYRGDVLINWGCGRINRNLHVLTLLNLPEAVNVAGNKLLTFSALAGVVPSPDFTSDIALAQTWLGLGGRVLERSLLRGSGGRGIRVVEPGSDLGVAPLYVKYVKKRKEFRVHVVNGQVIDCQEKRRRRGATDRVPFIFNYDNGYVFCRDDVRLPDGAGDLAVAAVAALGLSFGAVDIIWNEKHNQCYVLEVNTAPGLEGQTVVNYVNAFTGIINEQARTR